jgi:hypothetical protein
MSQATLVEWIYLVLEKSRERNDSHNLSVGKKKVKLSL